MRAGRCVLLFFVFLSFSVIFSYLTGYFYWSPLVILPLSLVATWFTNRKIGFELELERPVLLLSFVVMCIFIIPTVLFSSGFPASSDALSTTVIRIIGGRIPQTFEPYSALVLSYPIGILFFSKMLTQALPFHDYLVIWYFTAILGALQVILFHNFAKSLLIDKRQALVACTVFIGIRQLAYFVFWGLGPMIFAIDLFILAFVAFIRKSWLFYIFIAASFLNHPVGFAMSMFTIGAYSVWKSRRLEFLKALPIIIMLFPFVSGTYLGTVFGSDNVDFIHQTPLILVSLALWAGPLTSFFLIVHIINIVKKRSIKGIELFLLANIIVYLAGYLYLYSVGSRFFDLLFVPAGILIPVFVSFFAARYLKRDFILAIVACAVVVSLFSSGQFNEVMVGTKIDAKHIEFAEKFRQFDPQLRTVLFLTESGGWMAHIANKIPYDLTDSNFLPPFGTPKDVVDGFSLKKSIRGKIIAGCNECVSSLKVDYIVSPNKLPLLSGPVFVFNGFYVYSTN